MENYWKWMILQIKKQKFCPLKKIGRFLITSVALMGRKFIILQEIIKEMIYMCMNMKLATTSCFISMYGNFALTFLHQRSSYWLPNDKSKWLIYSGSLLDNKSDLITHIPIQEQYKKLKQTLSCSRSPAKGASFFSTLIVRWA